MDGAAPARGHNKQVEGLIGEQVSGAAGAADPARPGGWLRRAIAFANSAEPRLAPSRRAILADLCLAAVALAGALAATLARSPVPPAAVLAGALATMPLAGRRLAPLTAFWVILATAIVASQYGTVVTFASVVFAAYCAVVYSRFRGLALLSLALAGITVSAAFRSTAPPLPGRVTALVVLAAIMIVGTAVRTWNRRARDSQASIGRLHAQHQAETARAVELERARIARELHDVVTHNVSVMVVQAGAARQVLSGSPAEATTALLAVEASGRAAMTELRHMLGLLAPAGTTADESLTVSEAGAAGADPLGADPLGPQPGLDRLPPLIDRMTAAGLPVELSVSGVARALPSGLELAAYRVVQEALTNVLKHAGPGMAMVRIDYQPDEILIEVADDGRPDPPVPEPRETGSGRGEGRGLLGLRERVALYQGDFTAGPRPGGGWLVRARLRDESPPADPSRHV